MRCYFYYITYNMSLCVQSACIWEVPSLLALLLQKHKNCRLRSSVVVLLLARQVLHMYVNDKYIHIYTLYIYILYIYYITMRFALLHARQVLHMYVCTLINVSAYVHTCARGPCICVMQHARMHMYVRACCMIRTLQHARMHMHAWICAQICSKYGPAY
jgi:hypothetical protein